MCFGRREPWNSFCSSCSFVGVGLGPKHPAENLYLWSRRTFSGQCGELRTACQCCPLQHCKLLLLVCQSTEHLVGWTWTRLLPHWWGMAAGSSCRWPKLLRVGGIAVIGCFANVVHRGAFEQHVAQCRQMINHNSAKMSAEIQLTFSSHFCKMLDIFLLTTQLQGQLKFS